jgi:hypothetical protein
MIIEYSDMAAPTEFFKNFRTALSMERTPAAWRNQHPSLWEKTVAPLFGEYGSSLEEPLPNI